MTTPRGRSDAMPPEPPELPDAPIARKPYRVPECRKLGDMKHVTMKTGPNTDGSNPNPTRP
jgi:hypothetical protein